VCHVIQSWQARPSLLAWMSACAETMRQLREDSMNDVKIGLQCQWQCLYTLPEVSLPPWPKSCMPPPAPSPTLPAQRAAPHPVVVVVAAHFLLELHYLSSLLVLNPKKELQ